MPHYLFQCDTPACGRERTIKRSMAECTFPALCDLCGSSMHRRFTVPQINTNPFLLQDENKYGMYDYATSQKDITEIRKADDKKYEALHS